MNWNLNKSDFEITFDDFTRNGKSTEERAYGHDTAKTQAKRKELGGCDQDQRYLLL